MTSAIDATEAATFTALDGNVVGSTIYQHVPEDTPPPVTIIGDMEAVPLGAKDDKDRRVSLTLVTIVEAEERKPLSAIQDQLETLLDGKTFTVPGWRLSFVFESADGAQLPDGETYLGNSRFTVFAFAA